MILIVPYFLLSLLFFVGARGRLSGYNPLFCSAEPPLLLDLIIAGIVPFWPVSQVSHKVLYVV